MDFSKAAALLIAIAFVAWMWWEATHPAPDPDYNGPDGTYPRDEDGYTNK
jgi:hypothetical protein